MKYTLGKWGTAIVCVVCLCQFSPSQTDQKEKISLKDGRVLIGTVVERIPDKAIVLSTADGNEIIEIENILKEEKYIPKIISITPFRAEAGATIKIIGADLGSRTSKSLVRFGTVVAAINSWDDNQIIVTVPKVNAGRFDVTVSGDDFSIQSPVGFEVVDLNKSNTQIQQSQRRKLPPAQEQPSAQQTQQYSTPTSEPPSIGRFLIQFAYASPLKQFKETSGQDAGFAKPGFAGGWEGRAALSDNFYIPFSMDVAFLGLNTDELSNQLGYAVSSDQGNHFVSWLSMGLGLAIPMSRTSYLFASGEYGLSYTELPDLTITYTDLSITQESASAFSSGLGFSFGITFDAITFGYKIFTTKPKYTLHYSTNSFFTSSPSDQDIEQPTSVGIIYMGINIE